MHDPVGDREREIHIHVHHDPHIVMRGMVAANGVDEGRVTHEPVVLDVAAIVKRLVNHVVADHGRESDIPCIGVDEGRHRE